ncbi:MAG: RNA polymerase sigma factor [Anaerolineae bacterium]
MDDLQAVEQIKRGNPAALAWLVQRYQTQAVRAAYAITQDRQSAEDVVQNAFLQLFRTLQTFDSRRPFAPWFFKSVVNAALKTAKQMQRSLSIDTVLNDETGDTFADILPDLAAMPIEHVEGEELKQRVREALTKLTPEQRSVLVMRYYLDLETSEISAQLDCPPATIRWRMHHALKRLRGLLPLMNEN